MKNLTFLHCLFVAMTAFAFVSCDEDERVDELD